MPRSPRLLALAAFAAAALLFALVAGLSATVIEKITHADLRVALEAGGHGWAQVETDGLQVILSGTAPSEAARYRAITAASAHVDAARIVDATDVKRAEAVAAPAFSLELLRNDERISLIGLVPAATDRAALVGAMRAIVGEGGEVADMLDAAEYPVPPGWAPALEFGLSTLKALPSSKISIATGAVAVQAITDSAEAKARIESDLRRRVPGGVDLTTRIAAPRPVLTPFTLRFLLDGEGARFDACSADTERARARILKAAAAAGVEGEPGCTVGMGTPSPRWAEAADMAIGAVARLGAGTLTISDADIALVVPESVAQGDFDREVGELESNLPEVFSLKAERLKPADAAGPAPDFSVVLSREGRVELRGRLTDQRLREAAESLAKARFGAAKVYGATRLDEGLPPGWAARTLATIEAVSRLGEGRATVTADLVTVAGVSGNPQASDEIARLFGNALGEGAKLDLRIRYDKRLDPALALPSGSECAEALNGVLAKTKVDFEPGASVIAPEGAPVIAALAALMRNCADFRMEVAGHTDSQGREGFNLQLSHDRAEAVLRALEAQRANTANLTAKGYGESQPAAPNDSEAGREANRRIEFVLLDSAPVEGTRAAPDGPQDGPQDAAPADAETEAAAEAEAGRLAPAPAGARRPKPRPAR